MALISLAALAVLLLLGAMLIAKLVYDGQFPRVEAPPFSGHLRYSDVTGYPRQAVTFPSGPNTLAGYVYGAEHNQGLVVLSHGLGYDAEHYLAHIVYFVDHGWRVFAFDNTGTHESGGAGTGGLPQSVVDLDAALTYIAHDPALQALPVMLYGHSWGGYAVTAVLNYDHPVAATVSLAGFNSPAGLLQEGAHATLGVFAYPEYPFLWAYQALRFGAPARLTAVGGLNRAPTPALLIHGSADTEIRYAGASILAQRAAITNPNVVYLTRADDGRNGHNTLFLSEGAIAYTAAQNDEYRRLYDAHGGDLPDDVKAAFYAGVDKFQTSELDADLMATIERFFAAQLQ